MSIKHKRQDPIRSPVFHLKTLSVAMFAAMFFSGANAAGLGKITVLSGLGQPLNAEIELTTASRDEVTGLSVKLASLEAFRQANIEFLPALYSLRFAVEQRGSGQVVRVTSAQALNEPFVDMLLEVSGNNSKLVREYTFLLDPPELRRSQGTQTASGSQIAPAPAMATPMPSSPRAQAAERQAEKSVNDAIDRRAAAREAVRQRRAERAEAVSARRAARAESAEARRTAAGAPAVPQATGQQVEVKQGDTLGRIAASVKPEGVSLDQMLVALYQANPDAFVGKNMNRLRSGQILSVPDASAAAVTATGEAHGIVIAQATDFNSYRSKLAARAAVGAPKAAGETGQSATGKIGTRVEEQVNSANSAKDKLTLSKSGATGPNASTEDKLAGEKAAAEASARLRDLEKNVGDLEKLLALKNKDLADRQQAAELAKGASSATTGAGVVPAVPQPSGSAITGLPASSAAAGVPASATAATASAASATSTASSVPASAAATAPAASKPKAKLSQPVPMAAPSPFDFVLENPILVGGGGVLLAILAAFGIHTGRRRRKLQQQLSEGANFSDNGLASHSLFGAAGGQNVDTSNSVFNSSFTPSASQLDTNEVDPVAEADVYIAYGRDAQAEEILREALRTRPERNAVRGKLLEIYASRRDLQSFKTMATELHGLTGGQGPDWQQAAQLGRTLDATDDLYTAGQDMDARAASDGDELDLGSLLNTTATGMAPDAQDDTHESKALVQSDSAVQITPTAAASAEVVRIVGDDRAPLEFARAESSDPTFEPVAISAPVIEVPAANTAAPFVAATAIAAASAAAPLSAAPSVKAVEPELEDNSLDFDFDLDPPAASAEPVGVNPAGEPQSSDPFDFDFDLMKPVAEQPLPSVLSSKDAEEFAEDDSDAGSVAQPSAAIAAGLPPLDLDMSAISLELDAVPAVAHATAADTVPAASVAVGSSAGRANSAEMATKLDLALAYQEIGDAEGARELLDEVIQGGAPDQVEKAQSLRLKLA